MREFRKIILEINEEIQSEYGIHNAYEKYCGYFTLEDITTIISVYAAAHYCASGFMHKKDTLSFMDLPFYHSTELAEKVKSGKFRPRYYPEKEINERGKLRYIKPPTFECKVVQKNLCNILVRPALECRMISTNYASVTGRGTADILRAINRAAHTNSSAVIVILDYSGYFANIRLDIIRKTVFEKHFHDQNIVRLIMSFSPDEKGMSLGNELSQIPTSYFPSSIDHEFKDHQRLPYFRYCDDSLSILKNRREAEEYIEKHKAMAAKLGITIKDSKIQIIPIGESFVYCKERFLWNKKGYYYCMINPAIPKKEKAKLKSMGRMIKDLTMQDITAIQQYLGSRGVIAAHRNTKHYLDRLDMQYRKSTGQEVPKTKTQIAVEANLAIIAASKKSDSRL